MNELLRTIVLAIVQGVTEFLPVSSSGHLAIIGHALSTDSEHDLLLFTLLHAGTLVAILVVYCQLILDLLKRKAFKVFRNVIIGTIPTGIIGLGLHFSGLADKLFGHVLLPGIGLLITGTILTIGSRQEPGEASLDEMTMLDSLLIGLFQGLAIVPGISRSGSTIATAIHRKVARSDAAAFSFLLAIPAIVGATGVEVLSAVLKHDVEWQGGAGLSLSVGFVVAAVVGYASLRLLLVCVKKGKLFGYAIYCFLLGTGTILWHLLAS